MSISATQVPKKILVPVDFSEGSQHALQYALTLAEPMGATVEVLHVWEPPAYVGPEMVVQLNAESGERTLADFARTEVKKELEEFLSKVTSPNKSSDSLEGKLEFGSVVPTIIDYARNGQYDLIIIGTHGRTGLSRFILGSIAENVVRRSEVPVLTVRAPE